MNKKIEERNNLPSAHQIGDSVWFTLWSNSIVTEVTGIHFTAGKVKYDLRIFGDDGEVTIIRGVDSFYVKASLNS